MEYKVNTSLLLDLGCEGYVFDFAGVNFFLCKSWDKINSWIEYFSPFVRFLLLPWCLRWTRVVSRNTGLSAGAVIVLTSIASLGGCLAFCVIKITLKWPDWIIKRFLAELMMSGYLCTRVIKDEICYVLTTNAKLSILVSKPIDDPDLPKWVNYVGKTSLVYHRMVNMMLRLNHEPILPVRGDETGHYFAPIGNIDLVSQADSGTDMPVLEDYGSEMPPPDDDSSQNMPEMENQMQEMPVLEDPVQDAPPVDFFVGLDQAYDAYKKNYGSLKEFVDAAEQCLHAEINESVRDRFNYLKYNELDIHERAVFLLLCHQFYTLGVEPMRLTVSLGVNSSDFAALRIAAGSLVGRGIAEVPPGHTFSGDVFKDDDERFLLSSDAVGALFKGRQECINYAAISHQADIVRAQNIKIKPLHFDGEMTKDVNTLKTLLCPAKFDELAKLLSQHGRKSLTCLFYGAPGTGKTELARQLAAETGRDIMIADAAKIYGSYIGDTEKNVREVFRTFRYLSKVSDRAPILLFNEADGILSKRLTSVRCSADKSENAVQGIILQELENLEGIFIATTNLAGNLDEAMDRRFLFKLHFGVPTADVRARILRDRMPWLSVQTAEAIAGEFILSGGQLDNVVSRCMIEESLSGDKPSEEDIRAFCLKELSINDRRSGSHVPNRIGFDYKGRV